VVVVAVVTMAEVVVVGGVVTVAVDAGAAVLVVAVDPLPPEDDEWELDDVEFDPLDLDELTVPELVEGPTELTIDEIIEPIDKDIFASLPNLQMNVVHARSVRTLFPRPHSTGQVDT
jgi:hypothetical protein